MVVKGCCHKCTSNVAEYRHLVLPQPPILQEQRLEEELWGRQVCEGLSQVKVGQHMAQGMWCGKSVGRAEQSQIFRMQSYSRTIEGFQDFMTKYYRNNQ